MLGDLDFPPAECGLADVLDAEIGESFRRFLELFAWRNSFIVGAGVRIRSCKGKEKRETDQIIFA